MNKKEILPEQIESLYKMANIGTTSYLFIMILTFILLSPFIETHLLYTLVASSFIVFIYRYLLIIKFNNFKKNKLKWVHLYSVGILLTSLIWGMGAILISIEGMALDFEFILLAILIGLSASAITTIGMIYRIYIMFLIPLILPSCIYHFYIADRLHIISGIMLISSIIFFLKAAYNYSSAYYNLIIKDHDIINKERKFSQSILDLSIKILEDKDEYTSGHAKRVSDLSVAFAKELKLSDEEIEILQRGAYLHDIGKLFIPDHILKKDKPLTAAEYKIMKDHPQKGFDLLYLANDDIIRKSLPIIKHHHERCDGLGYPDRLTEEEIPFLAKIVSIVDTYDAMTTSRAYRKALSPTIALYEINKCKNAQFDYKLCNSFIDIMIKKESITLDKKYSSLILELKKDHLKMLNLFSKLSSTNITDETYFDIISQIEIELQNHITKENKHFYPPLLKEANRDDNFKTALDYFIIDNEILTKAIKKFSDSVSDKSTLSDDHIEIRNNLSDLLIKRINLEESLLFNEYESRISQNH